MPSPLPPFHVQSADVFKGNFPGFGWMKNVPQWSKPIMMAAVTGAVGVFYPQVCVQERSHACF